MIPRQEVVWLHRGPCSSVRMRQCRRLKSAELQPLWEIQNGRMQKDIAKKRKKKGKSHAAIYGLSPPSFSPLLPNALQPRPSASANAAGSEIMG